MFLLTNKGLNKLSWLSYEPPLFFLFYKGGSVDFCVGPSFVLRPKTNRKLNCQVAFLHGEFSDIQDATIHGYLHFLPKVIDHHLHGILQNLNNISINVTPKMVYFC